MLFLVSLIFFLFISFIYFSFLNFFFYKFLKFVFNYNLILKFFSSLIFFLMKLKIFFENEFSWADSNILRSLSKNFNSSGSFVSKSNKEIINGLNLFGRSFKIRFLENFLYRLTFSKISIKYSVIFRIFSKFFGLIFDHYNKLRSTFLFKFYQNRKTKKFILEKYIEKKEPNIIYHNRLYKSYMKNFSHNFEIEDTKKKDLILYTPLSFYEKFISFLLNSIKNLLMSEFTVKHISNILDFPTFLDKHEKKFKNILIYGPFFCYFNSKFKNFIILLTNKNEIRKTIFFNFFFKRNKHSNFFTKENFNKTKIFFGRKILPLFLQHPFYGKGQNDFFQIFQIFFKFLFLWLWFFIFSNIHSFSQIWEKFLIKLFMFFNFFYKTDFSLKFLDLVEKESYKYFLIFLDYFYFYFFKLYIYFSFFYIKFKYFFIRIIKKYKIFDLDILKIFKIEFFKFFKFIGFFIGFLNTGENLFYFMNFYYDDKIIKTKKILENFEKLEFKEVNFILKARLQYLQISSEFLKYKVEQIQLYGLENNFFFFPKLYIRLLCFILFIFQSLRFQEIYKPLKFINKKLNNLILFFEDSLDNYLFYSYSFKIILINVKKQGHMFFFNKIKYYILNFYYESSVAYYFPKTVFQYVFKGFFGILFVSFFFIFKFILSFLFLLLVYIYFFFFFFLIYFFFFFFLL